MKGARGGKPELPEYLRNIVDSISRGKGSWSLANQDGNQLLTVGSVRTVRVNGGFIVSIGLNRDQLTQLRDAADALLKEQS